MNNVEFYNSFRIKVFEFLHSRQHAYRDTPFHYIIYVYRGSGRFTWLEDSRIVGPGDFLYIPMGINYHSAWANQMDTRFLSIGFRHLPQQESMSYPMQRIESTPEAAAIADQIAADPQTNCTTVGLIYQLIGCLQKQMLHTVESKKSRLVEAAKLYWQQNPFASAAETARHLGVSESSLYAAFRSVCGCTLVDAKHNLLATAAVLLLLSTDLSIEAISEQLGFSSAAYFRKVFRDQMGTSPRDVRRQGESPRLKDLLDVEKKAPLEE